MPAINSRPPPADPARDAGAAPRDAAPTGSGRSVAPSMCSCELDTEPGPAGPILVLRVAGEIDLITLPLLQQALTAAVDQRPADLVVDLAAVGFCCVRGFALLATTARTTGTGYALSGLPAHLDRFATLLWPEHPVTRYASAAAAVTAIRIEQTHGPPERRATGSMTATRRFGGGPAG